MEAQKTRQRHIRERTERLEEGWTLFESYPHESWPPRLLIYSSHINPDPHFVSFLACLHPAAADGALQLWPLEQVGLRDFLYSCPLVQPLSGAAFVPHVHGCSL